MDMVDKGKKLKCSFQGSSYLTEESIALNCNSTELDFDIDKFTTCNASDNNEKKICCGCGQKRAID